MLNNGILNINLFFIPEQRDVPTTKVGLIAMEMDVMHILHPVRAMNSMQMRMVLIVCLLVVSVEGG